MKSSTFAALLGIALPASAAPTSSITSEALSVCKELASASSSHLVYSPKSSQGSHDTAEQAALWKNASQVYWNAINEEDVPACVFFPSSAEEVSAAVKALNKQPRVPFALKSGGHNWNPGFSSTNGGVLISFRPNLQSTTLSSDGQSAKVGPGSRWVEAMEILDKSNKCIVGGRNGDVGVGGYLLQGGISYLTSQYGFACDNVLEYEFVTANGTILTVNKDENPDLFWALRGGGNAFGIVTMYTLKTHDIDEVWGGNYRVHPKDISTFNTAITDWIASNKDPLAAIIPNHNFVQENLTQVVSVDLFYQAATPPPDVFAVFTSIPQISNTTKTQRYPTLLGGQGAGPAFGIRVANGFNSLPNLPSANSTSFLNWQWDQGVQAPFMNNLKSNGLVLFSMAIQCMSVGVQEAHQAQGPGALSLDPKNGDKIWIEYDMGWLNADYDNYFENQLQQYINDASTYMKETYGGIHPTKYVSGDLAVAPYNPLFMNDAGSWQDILGSYGSDSYNRLKSIHQSLDPDNFFTSRQDGWFFE